MHHLQSSLRCTAPADNLDGSRYPLCSREHTEVISAKFELGELWDEYSLVGDIVVGAHFHDISVSIFLIFYSHSQMHFLGQIFMSFSHLIYFINSSRVLSRTT